jgi:hypothetical protein
LGLKALGWNVLILSFFWDDISLDDKLPDENDLRCVSFWDYISWMKYSGWIFLMCHFLRLHFWMKISWCGHFLGWNILDECLNVDISWMSWMKCLNLDISWNVLDECLNVDISWMSWMKCLNLDISWNVLDECLNLDMRWQFLDEIGASLLPKPICFRSRAWMSGDCIGTVAVAEKGECWQAHVQRIQAPPLLLASSSSSSGLTLWSRSEMRKRGDTTKVTRETRYVMLYYCCFLERWTWVSLHLLSSSSSLYRSASNAIYIFEAAQWFFTCTTRKSEFPEDSVTVVLFRAICSVKARHIRRQRARGRGIGAGVRRSHDVCVG